jgi:hypothetical protein
MKFQAKGQVVVASCYAKQKKYESMEDYYDWFLQLCAVIPQQHDDIIFVKHLKKDYGPK